MTRIQAACLCLLASALVLAGLLIARVGDLASPAYANMVTGKSDFQFLTARTEKGEDALFVLDNRSQKLVIYTTDVRGRNGTIRPVGGMNLAREFTRLESGARRP